MFYKATAYFLFLLQSFTQKKITSEFILEIKKKCLQASISTSKIPIFNNYYQHLLSNKNTIKITDFGAGSSVFKSNIRSISKIAQVAGINNKKAIMLFNFVEFLQPKNILEIGTSLGLATTVLAANNSNSTIITLEGCTETAKIAQQQFDKFNLNTINLRVGNFSKTLPKAVKNNTFDLIYFDGNHQKKATLDYFNKCLPTATKNSIFIFDDIYWNTSMQAAWKEIKNNPKVTSTIDTFQWGIVFFSKELTKEHYVIYV